jgi:DNA-binding response OmpR family regulator
MTVRESRIHLQLKRCTTCNAKVAHFNGFAVHCRKLQWGGPAVHLTQNESALVAALLYPPGFHRSREELCTAMYPDPDTSPLSLRQLIGVHIHNLRKKFHESKVPIVIEAGQTRGFCLRIKG